LTISGFWATTRPTSKSTVYNKVGREEVEIGIEVAKEVLKGVHQMSELLGRLRNLQARQTP